MLLFTFIVLCFDKLTMFSKILLLTDHKNNKSSTENHLKCCVQLGARNEGKKLVYVIIHTPKTIHLEVNTVNKDLIIHIYILRFIY